MEKKKSKINIIVLVILFSIFFSSIGLDLIIVQTLSDIFTRKYVTSYVLDNITLSDDMEELDDICNRIKKSENLDKITYNYLKTISFNVMHSCYKNLRIEKYINNIIQEDLNNIDEEKKVFLKYNLDIDYFQNICDRTTDALNNGWNSSKIIVILYSIFSSVIFRGITALIIMFFIYRILKENEDMYKKIFSIGISIICSSLVLTICILIIKLFEWKFTNIVIGRTSDIRIRNFGIMNVVIFSIGVILLIVPKLILKKKVNNKIEGDY